MLQRVAWYHCISETNYVRKDYISHGELQSVFYVYVTVSIIIFKNKRISSNLVIRS